MTDLALSLRPASPRLSSDAWASGRLFQLPDSVRDDWTLSVGVRTHWPLTSSKRPSGATQRIESFFPDPQAVRLSDLDLDGVFRDLVRDERGRARRTVKGRSQRLDILLGPNYRAVVIYDPKPPSVGQAAGESTTGPTRNFVCVEPVAGIINTLNLAHRGVPGSPEHRSVRQLAGELLIPAPTDSSNDLRHRQQYRA